MRWLKTYYPFEQTAGEKWNTIVILSLILSFLLLILQPYGFSPLNKLQAFTGYVIIGSLTLIINYFSIPAILPKLFDIKSWSIYKSLFFYAFNFLIIGCWFHLFNAKIIHNNPMILISITELLITIFKIMFIGLIASSFLILFRYNIITRKNLQLSQDLNQSFLHQLKRKSKDQLPQNTVILCIENKSIPLSLNQLRVISSEGNYISLHLSEKTSKLANLYRGTIKEIEEQLKAYPQFFRCHRSHIVNLDHIESTKGNSQGLVIRLGEDLEIPIARSRIKEFRELLGTAMV